jgi:alpha-glucosidase
MARSSYEAGLKYNNGNRPFVLTRSAFAGVQRYSAVWSGDNTASDEGLLSGVLLNSQMSLSGIPFVGPDLGGYIGDGSKDLFKRWIEVGVFSPYVRNHKEFFATANEPWSYGEEAEMISKSYIGFRYRLMPYIYSKFYEASLTAMPIARSLCINYPHDDNVYDTIYQYQFLFGDALMVVPVTTKENIKKIYLPTDEWYDLYTDERVDGGKEITKEVPAYQIPVYVKGSSIIPMQGLVQSTKENPGDTLAVHIYNGRQNNAFTYYEDSGDGFEYQKGSFYKRTISFDPAQRLITFSKPDGTYIPGFKKIEIVLHGFEQELTKAKINAREQQLQKCAIKLLDGLEYLGDYYDKATYNKLRAAEPKMQQQFIVTDNFPGQINIQLY